MARRTREIPFLEDEPPPPLKRMCDHPDCLQQGEFRAPKSRSKLNDFYWFCLDHVREYNKTWNYYAGMSPEEVERETRSDAGWGRPTWPLGKRGPGDKPREQRMNDPFDFFSEDGKAEARARNILDRNYPANYRKAIDEYFKRLAEKQTASRK